MHRFLNRFLLVAVFAALPSGGVQGEEEDRGRRVMTWVPPYAVSACRERLNESFQGTGMKDGLTHLGLQFWNPTDTGGIEIVTRFAERIDDDTILEFRRWGKTHGIRIMLCVYNGTSAGWDWELAQSAFAEHRTRLVDALVAETVRLGLDGVDLDFEGEGDLEASRESFVRFTRELARRLHAEGKELSVNTFAHKWNAPRQGWWGELLPHLDGLNVMGYAATGAGAAAWRSYRALKAAAGRHPGKLCVGMPGGVAEWQGSSLETHLRWVLDDGVVGLAIWDARLKDPAWRTKETWRLIAKIKDGLEPAPAGGDGPRRPRLDGPWIQLVGRPPLERWASPEVEPVDFAIFRADDGRWQLIACVRRTTHPGGGRLLYRWSSAELTREDWRPEGIFLTSKPEWDHAEGRVQAPFHVKDDGKHYLFYNSRGGHLLTSADGLAFEPFGTKAVFPMGRDVCVLDDRARSGNWIAYYTSPEKGINPATRDHTIRARTATELEGPWSEEASEIPPITPPPSGYEFVYAESPLVVKRGHHYYRFEQLHVFRSEDPLKWEGPPVATLAPRDPLKRLAPEIATHDGRDYLLAYQWRGKDPRGIFLAPLAWEKDDGGGR